MKNKKVIVFDLDNTLAISKQAISEEIAGVLKQLLEEYEVLIISGGKWELFQSHIIERMNEADHLLHRLHMMPTCGTSYYQFIDNEWANIYSEDLNSEEIEEISLELESSAKELGYWEDNTTGEIIENRGSQVTYSALGQKAIPEDKYKWDPNHSKKKEIRDHVACKLSQFDVKVGGTTSIDVTKPGIDKAYGVGKFIDRHNYSIEQLLFFGDMLQEGGNDYPVKAMGVESTEVKNPDHTRRLITDFLNK